MKKAKNELLQLLAGLLMLVAGLFILSQKVMVSSGFFGYGFMIGGIHLGNGLIMVPFIIGILWMFGSGGSLLSKLFTIASVVIIIVAIIMTTNLSMIRISLYEWVLILVLIFGGAGLVARLLLSDRKDAARNADAQKTEEQRRIDTIEAEIERIKKNM
ncbi:MAG: hypothetical protein HDR19_03675 [Lachnospiraceae bacterium]|nr:hypothetical protein [Lachnospiraceae bacterium]